MTPGSLGPLGARLSAEVGRVLVGQNGLVNRLLIGLLTNGHVLLEGVPGVAKTLAVRSVAAATSLTFSRIQFTPDLLPADVTGTMVFDPRATEFKVHRGPVFAQVVLADEINRAPAKTQSALLQAMEERAVTIGTSTYGLGPPFVVLATQNPLEHEGTYPLPEAQLDRFMLHVRIGYPGRADEQRIVSLQIGQQGAQVRPVLSAPALAEAQVQLGAVRIDGRILEYLVDVVRVTRAPADAGLADLAGLVRSGASPRAAVHLALAARAHAYLDGRGYVLPEDVTDVAPDVLRHRLLLTYDADLSHVTADELLRRLLEKVPVP